MYSVIIDIVQNPIPLAALLIALIIYNISCSKRDILKKIPLNFTIAYLFFEIVTESIRILGKTQLPRWVDPTATFLLSCAVIRLTVSIILELWFRLRPTKVLPKITRDFLLIALYAATALWILRTRGGVDLSGLLTTSAVLTAIIGLAAQNMLGNLFSGVVIQIERPYHIGDWIQFGDQVGQVVGIHWKSTMIKTFEDELIYVPNLDIVKSVLKNYSKPTRKHWTYIAIGLDYSAPPNLVTKVLLDVCRDDQRIVKDPAPVVRLVKYDDSSITYNLRFMYDDFSIGAIIKSDLQIKLWYSLKRHGINIPYPIRDVSLRHIERRNEERLVEKLKTAARNDLDSIPILGPLSSAERDDIAQKMTAAKYGERESIVRQGDPGDSLFLLHKGSCEIFVSSEDKEPLKVATLMPPAFFGEMSLLTGEPRSATVIAREDSSLFVIDQKLFGEIITKHPSIADDLARIVADRQSSSASLLDKAQENINQRTQSLANRIKSFFRIG